MSEENFNTENVTNGQNYSQPQQTYSQPQQAYEQPQQTYSQPQQTYSQPQQNYDQQAYNQNQQYAQQNYGYDQSQQAYGTYQQPQQQAYGNYDQTQTQYTYNQTTSSGKGMAIASMVLGIVSIPGICFWIVGLPCAIVGLILGIIYNKNNEHSPMAVAGIVCSIITIAILVLVLILYIVGAVSLSSLGYSYYY